MYVKMRLRTAQTAYFRLCLRRMKHKLKTYSLEDIKLSPEEVGMKGSPTYVSKAFRPEQKQGGEVITPENASEGAKIIKEKLEKYQIKWANACPF